MKSNKKKNIPKFKSEGRERAFWSKHDSADYVDYRRGKHTLFPNLKSSVRTISIRLPESLLEAIKMLAHKRDVPYQSLMKIILAKEIEKALH